MNVHLKLCIVAVLIRLCYTGCLVPVLEHGYYKRLDGINVTTNESVQSSWTIILVCHLGYEVTGGHSLYCQWNGQWDGQPQCRGIICQRLPVIDHGSYTFAPGVFHRYPATATLTCNAGYRSATQPPPTISCQVDGSWSASTAQCVGIICQSLPVIDHGSYTFAPGVFHHYPATATLTCNAGYRFTTQHLPTISCQMDGSWSASRAQCEGVKCDNVTNPANGKYNASGLQIHFPARLSLTCNKGYMLKEENISSIQCSTDGHWSQPQPSCEAVPCRKPGLPDHGKYNTTTARFGEVISVTCDEGYETEELVTRMCQANGAWSPLTTNCQAKRCPVLKTIAGGDYSININETAKYLTTAAFTCGSGYEIHVGSSAVSFFNRTCLANRTWSGQEPACIPLPSAQESSAMTVGISVAATVVVILVVVVAAVILRRRALKGTSKQRKAYETTLNNGPSTNEYEVVGELDIISGRSTPTKQQTETTATKETVYINDGTIMDTSGNEYYSFEESRMPETAISLKDIADFVLSDPNSEQIMKKQFESFKEGLHDDYDDAVTPVNRPKNRYKNIYPYDANRVKLKPVKGVAGSDFINASPVNGYSVVNAYIATQGPLPSTLGDFWKMIWQFDCGKIVMLTNLLENKKNKCCKYWPDDDSCDYGEITVTPEAVQVYSEFVVRTFLIKQKTKGNDSNTSEKRIEQFHFTAWPDKGVPKYSSSLVHFRSKIKYTEVQAKGPVVVHCSAGIGRTGTFIGLDWLVDQSETVGFVDVAACVATLRRQRMNMVQTEEQYIFLHHTLVEALMLSSTALPAADFPQTYQNLLETDSRTGKRKLDTEFGMLTKMSPVIDDSEYADIGKFSKKNRSSDILPVTMYMPKLPGNEFINAVFMPSYKNNEAFILTDTPTDDSVVNFWKLIYHNDVASIVMMDAAPQTEDAVEMYWPEPTSSKTYGDIEVLTTDVEKMGAHQKTTMKVTLGKKTKVVKQFKCLYWPEGTAVPPDPIKMLEHMELVLGWQQSTPNKQIVVHCMNGADRSGLYCVVSAVIERLKIEQDVAICQMIEQMRSRREQIITNVEQFQFCHEAVLAYMDQFENYSNFTKK